MNAVPLDVPRRFHRNYAASGERARESAAFKLSYLLDRFGWQDFSEVAVLDVGCGTKLTDALLDRPIAATPAWT